MAKVILAIWNPSKRPNLASSINPRIHVKFNFHSQFIVLRNTCMGRGNMHRLFGQDEHTCITGMHRIYHSYLLCAFMFRLIHRLNMMITFSTICGRLDCDVLCGLIAIRWNNLQFKYIQQSGGNHVFALFCINHRQIISDRSA